MSFTYSANSASRLLVWIAEFWEYQRERYSFTEEWAIFILHCTLHCNNVQMGKRLVVATGNANIIDVLLCWDVTSVGYVSWHFPNGCASFWAVRNNWFHHLNSLKQVRWIINNEVMNSWKRYCCCVSQWFLPTRGLQEKCPIVPLYWIQSRNLQNQATTAKINLDGWIEVGKRRNLYFLFCPFKVNRTLNGDYCLYPVILCLKLKKNTCAIWLIFCSLLSKGNITVIKKKIPLKHILIRDDFFFL